VATLRLFANLRETAGTTSADFAGDTVGAVIDAAVAAYGSEFSRGLETAKIWVNGEPAVETTGVDPTDEIALIPPVSGGAESAVQSDATIRAGLVLALLAAIFVANLGDSDKVVVLVAVVAAIAWLWDLGDAMAARRAPLQVIPAMAAAVAAATGASRWGSEGLAGGVAVGLMITLAWAVFDRRSRRVQAIAGTALLGVAAGLGTGGFVLVRLRDPDELTLFLVLATGASLAAWAVGRFAPDSPGIDPNVAGLVASLIGGIVAGVATDLLDFWVMLLVAVALGASFIAGRTLGSISRTGAVVHTARAPGLLTMFDGPLVAAGLFWAVLAIFA
jgi:molybdopterin converting factor small subunit